MFEHSVLMPCGRQRSASSRSPIRRASGALSFHAAVCVASPHVRRKLQFRDGELDVDCLCRLLPFVGSAHATLRSQGLRNIHGHAHGAPPGRSAHINVAVEQLDYEPVGLDRLRRLARALAAGHYPPGATTLERIAHLEQDADECTTKRRPQ